MLEKKGGMSTPASDAAGRVTADQARLQHERWPHSLRLLRPSGVAFEWVRWRHCTVPERSSMDHDARRDRMIRMALFIVVGLGLAGSPAAWAQNAVPGSDDNRYTLNRVDDGYLGLFGRHGPVRSRGGGAEVACGTGGRDRRPSGRERSCQERAHRAQSSAAWHRQAGVAGREARRAPPAIAQRRRTQEAH